MIKVSQLIVDNHKQFVNECTLVHQYLQTVFPTKDTTWNYRLYNIFSAASPSIIFYKLFKELNGIIREYVGHNEPLWMQSWLNYHTADTVLDWHDHSWPYHGYVSIDPKDTITKFETFEIQNKVGLIYIGEGNIKHKVEVLNNFNDTRITLGFDVHTEPGFPFQQLSLIPIE